MLLNCKHCCRRCDRCYPCNILLEHLQPGGSIDILQRVHPPGAGRGPGYTYTGPGQLCLQHVRLPGAGGTAGLCRTRSIVFTYSMFTYLWPEGLQAYTGPGQLCLQHVHLHVARGTAGVSRSVVFTACSPIWGRRDGRLIQDLVSYATTSLQIRWRDILHNSTS